MLSDGLGGGPGDAGLAACRIASSGTVAASCRELQALRLPTRNSKDIKHVLDQAGRRLGHPCDLDLLRFFRRHPRALLTSEQLAACVGYDVQQVDRSLDGLIGAGLVTRSQTPKVSARMYVLTSGGTHDGWLKSLLEVAATQEGRRALLETLTPRQSPGPSEPGGKLPAVRGGRLRGPREKAANG